MVLLDAGFQHVEIVDSGADLNAYAKIENQSGCCSPAMDATETPDPLQVSRRPAARPLLPATTLHDELTTLLRSYDVNAAAASVKVYAIKPSAAPAKSCCGPTCCS